MKLAKERLETMKDQVHPDLCIMDSWLKGEVVQLEGGAGLEVKGLG